MNITSNNYVLIENIYIDASRIKKPTILPLCIAKIIGLIKDLQFTLSTLISRRHHFMNYDKVIGDPQRAKALAVLIHGLNAHPSQMDGHAQALRKKLGEDVLIYQVQVEKKGNCSKREAVEKITKTALQILKNNTQMKLYAHGISNGGWLASQLAVDLLNHGIQGNRILVNANSAPLYGTKMMNDPSTAKWRQKIWKWIVQSPFGGSHAETVYSDFSWGSFKGKEIIQDIRFAAQNGVKFEFDGSFADSKVTPPSFFPKGVQGAEYFCPDTIEGHSSIIASQRQRQVQSACQFIMDRASPQ